MPAYLNSVQGILSVVTFLVIFGGLAVELFYARRLKRDVRRVFVILSAHGVVYYVSVLVARFIFGVQVGSIWTVVFTLWSTTLRLHLYGTLIVFNFLVDRGGQYGADRSSNS